MDSMKRQKRTPREPPVTLDEIMEIDLNTSRQKRKRKRNMGGSRKKQRKESPQERGSVTYSFLSFSFSL